MQLTKPIALSNSSITWKASDIFRGQLKPCILLFPLALVVTIWHLVKPEFWNNLMKR